MKRTRLYLLLPILVLSLAFLVLGCYTQIRRVSKTDTQQEQYVGEEEFGSEEERAADEVTYNYNFYGCDYPYYWTYWDWDWYYPYYPAYVVVVPYWWDRYNYYCWYDSPWVYRWHPYRYWDYYYGGYSPYYSGYYGEYYSLRPSTPHKQRDFGRRGGIDRRIEETPHMTSVARPSSQSTGATRMRKGTSSSSSDTKVQTQPDQRRTRIRRAALGNTDKEKTIRSTSRTTTDRPRLKTRPTRIRKRPVSSKAQNKSHSSGQPKVTRRSHSSKRQHSKTPSYTRRSRSSSSPSVSSPARQSKSSNSKSGSSTSKSKSSSSSRTRKH